MLLKHVALQMLAECSLDNSRLHLLDPEGFPGRDFSGLHIGVQDELLLGLAVGVPEAVKALVGHADKLLELLLGFLIVGQVFLAVFVAFVVLLASVRPLGVMRGRIVLA